MPIKNEKDNIYGELEIIGFSHIDKQGAYWKAVCNCNKKHVVIVRGISLRKGEKKSCGCLIKRKRGPKESLKDKQFNRLFVIEQAGQNKRGEYLWRCVCICKTETVVTGSHLKSGHTQSCGCYNKERSSQVHTGKGKNLVKERFGRLVVVEQVSKNRKGDRTWFCECNCGGKKIVSGDSLKRGNTQSCGCLQRERAKEANSGSNNWGWIFNREEVKAREKTRRYMYSCISRTVNAKNDHAKSILGYSNINLMEHIESLWKDDMSWDNYGKCGWHIDHKVPIAYFVKQRITDPKVINSLDNLQPLWAKDNLSKGARLAI